MRFGPRYCLFVVLSVVFSGCAKENAWTASQDKSYKDTIQESVEEKIEEQSDSKDGAELWAIYSQDEYQPSRAFAKDAKREELERKRQEMADRLFGVGPLSLDVCLMTALEFNDRIQAGRASIRSLGGDELIANSRFLPSLSYDLSASVTENLGHGMMMGWAATLTLLEFGKDNPVDVALRTLQRQELFGYEEVVASVLSDVRLRFFTILLRQQQLAERGKLRDEFVARYKSMDSRLTVSRIKKTALLTAELNVLNEESRINALEKEIIRQKMDLLKAIGLPVEMTDFELVGEPAGFDMASDESVDKAFRRSTRIAQARASLP